MSFFSLSGGPIDTSKPYSEADAKKIMQQLLSAVKLLHERGVIHRDIKPENIIRTSPNELNIKLIDFGLATYLAATEVLYDWCGTPEFQGTCLDLTARHCILIASLQHLN